MKSCPAFLLLAVVAALATLTGCPKSSAPPAVSQAPPASATSSAPVATPPVSESPGAASGLALAPPPETPVVPEKNPPGDIPDNQVFITYQSKPGMYSLKAPEGWARTESGADVKFADKFDGEQVVVTKAGAAPTVESVQKEQVAALEKGGRAVKVTEVKSKSMPGGQTVVYVTYTSNSEPDPVANKQVRLENVTYYYYMTGMLAALDAVGAPGRR